MAADVGEQGEHEEEESRRPQGSAWRKDMRATRGRGGKNKHSGEKGKQ